MSVNSSAPFFAVDAGAAYCTVVQSGQCVSDGEDTTHGNNERCTMRALVDL